MKYRTLPDTDLIVSQLVIGSTDAGTSIAEADMFAMLDAYFEAGGSFLDTAHVYAVWHPNGAGASEHTLGRWIKARGTRDKVTLATKGAHPLLDSMHTPRMSRAEIESDLDESLTRLGVEVIDLYWLHRDAVNVPVAEIVDTMDGFVRTGKIRYWGVSNWTTERIQAAMAYARSAGKAGLVANQPLGSLAKPNMHAMSDDTLTALDDPMLAFHRSSGLPAVLYTSQAKGYFTKRAENRLKPSDHERYDNPTNDRRFERVQELARRRDVSLTAVALAYLTSQSFPCMAIIGSHTLAQLRDSLLNADLTLTSEEIAYLEVS